MLSLSIERHDWGAISLAASFVPFEFQDWGAFFFPFEFQNWGAFFFPFEYQDWGTFFFAATFISQGLQGFGFGIRALEFI
jgi:hypothetical protein